MSHVVAKPFNSTQRRFREGARIGDGDDVSPHSIESLLAVGLIVVEGGAALSTDPARPRPGDDN